MFIQLRMDFLLFEHKLPSGHQKNGVQFYFHFEMPTKSSLGITKRKQRKHHTRVTIKPLGYERQHLLSGVLRVLQDMKQISYHRLLTNQRSRVDIQFVPPLEGEIGVTSHIARNIPIGRKLCTALQVSSPTIAPLRKRGPEVYFWSKPGPCSASLQTMYMENTSWARKP